MPYAQTRAAADEILQDVDLDAIEEPSPGDGLTRVLGLIPDVVLVSLRPSGKVPLTGGWQKLTRADMTPSYLAGLQRGNFGVVLGAASGGVCSIDIDQDQALEPFLELNPRLRATLRTTRVRGANLWVRIRGDYPKKTSKPTTADGAPWGEWRADGGQTVIHGEVMDPSKGETSPTRYRMLVEAPPVEIAFEEINWPEGLRLPWTDEPAKKPSPKPKLSSGKSKPKTPAASPEAARSGAMVDNVLLLPSGDVSITESAEAIFGRIAPCQQLFIRGGAVVELAVDGDGEHKLALVSASAFRSRLDDYGRVVAWRSGANGESVLKPAHCSVDTAQALLSCRAARELLPPVQTVIACPVAVEETGELRILPAGYHDVNGGILITGGDEPPRVAIEEATAALDALLAEFDFLTPGDHSRALASFLTPALKMGGWLTGNVPIEVAEADASQSGKTYLQRVVAAVYNQRFGVCTEGKGGVGSLDESFAQKLFSGSPFIQFDNLRGNLDSPRLESFLTGDGSFPVRIPHHGEIEVDPQRYFVFLTSNGVATSRDLANRASIVRIRHRGDYAFHPYPEGGLLEHVRANQAYYLGCVFSVIARWIELGRPRTAVREHSFRSWAQPLDAIVQQVFGAAPLLAGHGEAQLRVSNPSLNFLRAVALEVAQRGQLGHKLTASDLADLCEDGGIEIPGLHSSLEDHAKRQIGKLLSRVFGDASSLDLDELRVARGEMAMPRSDGGGDRKTKTYRFERLTGQSPTSAFPSSEVTTPASPEAPQGTHAPQERIRE